MDVEHEILQVSVHARLCVDRCLLISQQVVELHDTNGDSFIFLRLEHNLLQRGILDHLVGNDRRKVPSLSDVPPIVTVEGRVQVVS